MKFKFWGFSIPKLIIIFLLVSSLLWPIFTALAANSEPATPTPDDYVTGSLKQETTEKVGTGLETVRRFSRFAPTGAGGVVGIIVIVIRMALVFVGAIFLLMLVYGGYQWMTAGGNEETLKKARGVVKNAVIGLLVVLVSLSITLLVNYLLVRSLTESGGYMGVGVSPEGIQWQSGPAAPQPGSSGWLWGQ